MPIAWTLILTPPHTPPPPPHPPPHPNNPHPYTPQPLTPTPLWQLHEAAPLGSDQTCFARLLDLARPLLGSFDTFGLCIVVRTAARLGTRLGGEDLLAWCQAAERRLDRSGRSWRVGARGGGVGGGFGGARCCWRWPGAHSMTQ